MMRTGEGREMAKEDWLLCLGPQLEAAGVGYDDAY